MLMIMLGVAIVLATVVVALWKLQSSSRWSATTGVVESSEVRQIYRQPGTAMESDRQVFEYEAAIEYRYTIDGTEYSSDSVLAGMPSVFGNEANAQAVVNQYPANGNVTVYYDPQNPSSSALITGQSISVAGYIVIGLVIVLVLAAFSVAILIANGTIDLSQWLGPNKAR